MAERYRGVPVYHPREIDQMLTTGHSLTDEVGGFLTVSLSQVNRGFKNHRFTLPRWGLDGERVVRMYLPIISIRQFQVKKLGSNILSLCMIIEIMALTG